MPIPSGLPRNIEQCLNDYNIPLCLSHTVTDIHGDVRLEGVTVCEADEHMQAIPGTEQYIPCDTLILSVGLIPENELSLDAGVRLNDRTRGADVTEFFETSVPGIFAAGNVLHVHDLVDYVSQEAESLAEAVRRYIAEGSLPACPVQIVHDRSINHTVPMAVSGTQPFSLSLRVSRPMRDVRIVVSQSGTEIAAKRVRNAVPAEMIQFMVDAGKLTGKEKLEVHVECE